MEPTGTAYIINTNIGPKHIPAFQIHPLFSAFTPRNGMDRHLCSRQAAVQKGERASSGSDNLYFIVVSSMLEKMAR